MCSSVYRTLLLRYSFVTPSRMLKALARLMRPALKTFCQGAAKMARLANVAWLQHRISQLHAGFASA